MDKDVFTQTLRNSLNVISRELRKVNEKKMSLQNHPKVSINKLDFLRHHNEYLKMAYRSKLLYRIAGNIDTRLLKAAHLPVPKTKNMSPKSKEDTSKLKKYYKSRTYTTDEMNAFALFDFVTADIKRYRYIYGKDGQRKNVYDKDPDDPTTNLMIILGSKNYNYKGGKNKILHQAIVNHNNNKQRINKLNHRIRIANLLKNDPQRARREYNFARSRISALQQYAKDIKKGKDRKDYVKNAPRNDTEKGMSTWSTHQGTFYNQNFRGSDYHGVAREAHKDGLKATEKKYASSLDDFQAVKSQVDIGVRQDLVKSGNSLKQGKYETDKDYQKRIRGYRQDGVDNSIKDTKDKFKRVKRGNRFIEHCFDYFHEDPGTYQDVYPKLAKRKQKYSKEAEADPHPREYRTIGVVSMTYQKMMGLTPSESAKRIEKNLSKHPNIKRHYKKPLENFANARKDEVKQKEQQNIKSSNKEKSNNNVNLYNFINQDSDEGPEM